MDIVTSLTATTDFFLRPTTNRFVACSTSSAGCSPGGGGPTRRSGSRAGIGADALFGSFTTSIIVPSVPIRPWGAQIKEPRPVGSVRGSWCARCGHQKTVDPIRPTALVSASAALRLRVYLDQGTDLPSTALPLGALPCVMKAQMRKLIAVRSLLASL